MVVEYTNKGRLLKRNNLTSSYASLSRISAKPCWVRQPKSDKRINRDTLPRKFYSFYCENLYFYCILCYSILKYNFFFSSSSNIKYRTTLISALWKKIYRPKINIRASNVFSNKIIEVSWNFPSLYKCKKNTIKNVSR